MTKRSLDESCEETPAPVDPIEGPALLPLPDCSPFLVTRREFDEAVAAPLELVYDPEHDCDDCLDDEQSAPAMKVKTHKIAFAPCDERGFYVGDESWKVVKCRMAFAYCFECGTSGNGFESLCKHLCVPVYKKEIGVCETCAHIYGPDNDGTSCRSCGRGLCCRCEEDYGNDHGGKRWTCKVCRGKAKAKKARHNNDNKKESAAATAE